MDPGHGHRPELMYAEPSIFMMTPGACLAQTTLKVTLRLLSSVRRAALQSIIVSGVRLLGIVNNGLRPNSAGVCDEKR